MRIVPDVSVSGGAGGVVEALASVLREVWRRSATAAEGAREIASDSRTMLRARMNKHADIASNLKLYAAFAGFLTGITIGVLLSEEHPVLGVVAGLVSVVAGVLVPTFLLDVVFALIPARCPSCGVRAAFGVDVGTFTCTACGTTSRVRLTEGTRGGVDYQPVAVVARARVIRALARLHGTPRGAVSIAAPPVEGALSETPRRGAETETEGK